MIISFLVIGIVLILVSLVSLLEIVFLFTLIHHVQSTLKARIYLRWQLRALLAD